MKLKCKWTTQKVHKTHGASKFIHVSRASASHETAEKFCASVH